MTPTQTSPRAQPAIGLTVSGVTNCAGKAEVSLVLTVGIVNDEQRPTPAELRDHIGRPATHESLAFRVSRRRVAVNLDGRVVRASG